MYSTEMTEMNAIVCKVLPCIYLAWGELTVVSEDPFAFLSIEPQQLSRHRNHRREAKVGRLQSNSSKDSVCTFQVSKALLVIFGTKPIIVLYDRFCDFGFHDGH